MKPLSSFKKAVLAVLALLTAAYLNVACAKPTTPPKENYSTPTAAVVYESPTPYPTLTATPTPYPTPTLTPTSTSTPTLTPTPTTTYTPTPCQTPTPISLSMKDIISIFNNSQASNFTSNFTFTNRDGILYGEPFYCNDQPKNIIGSNKYYEKTKNYAIHISVENPKNPYTKDGLKNEKISLVFPAEDGKITNISYIKPKDLPVVGELWTIWILLPTDNNCVLVVGHMGDIDLPNKDITDQLKKIVDYSGVDSTHIKFQYDGIYICTPNCIKYNNIGQPQIGQPPIKKGQVFGYSPLLDQMRDPQIDMRVFCSQQSIETFYYEDLKKSKDGSVPPEILYRSGVVRVDGEEIEIRGGCYDGSDWIVPIWN